MTKPFKQLIEEYCAMAEVIEGLVRILDRTDPRSLCLVKPLPGIYNILRQMGGDPVLQKLGHPVCTRCHDTGRILEEGKLEDCICKIAQV